MPGALALVPLFLTTANFVPLPVHIFGRPSFFRFSLVAFLIIFFLRGKLIKKSDRERKGEGKLSLFFLPLLKLSK